MSALHCRRSGVIAILSSAIVFLLLHCLSPAYGAFTEIEATVELIHRRVRRSLDPETGERTERATYAVNVTAAGVTHRLNLQPATAGAGSGLGSIFAPGFRMRTLHTDADGRLVWTEATPSQERLDEIEGSIYRDVYKNTVVRVEEDDNGQLLLNGIVNDARIRSRRAAGSRSASGAFHKIKIELPPGAEEEKPIIPKVEVNPMGPEDPSADMIPETFKMPPGGRAPGAEPLTLHPKLAVVIEYNLYKAMQEEGYSPDEYMAIMVASANAKYALTPDPSIKAVLVSVIPITDAASQEEFMSPGKSSIEQGKYLLKGILDAFSKWVHMPDVRAQLGDHDVSPLQIGVEFDEDGLRGLAQTPGACRLDRGGHSAATPCSQDLGAFFSGSFTITHELAHNLGAPHDGDPETRDCPWGDGYIMSYLGWGTVTHFKLSPCSRKLIDLYARSDDGACLLKPAVREPGMDEKGLKLEGEKVNSEKICAKLHAGWVVKYQPPDESCRNTECAPPGPVTQYAVTNNPPGNGAPCGQGGKCRNGYCINPGKPLTPEELCQNLASDEKALFWQASAEYDPCQPGAPLVCRYELEGNPMVGQKEFKSIPGMPCHTDPQAILQDRNRKNAFDGVCFKGRCVRPADISGEPHKDCILRTGKEEAKLVAGKAGRNGCKTEARCTFGTESEVIEAGNDGAACEDDDGVAGACSAGVCKAGAATTPKPAPETTTLPPRPANWKNAVSVQDICKAELGSPAATVIRNKNRDEYCGHLNCKLRRRTKVVLEPIPDNIICGPLRKCKTGKCVICGQ